ncbi:MAG: homoserine dehydrogenase [Deltaproteobacteria bacterium]|nr:homoserine dehydrogenase [Deltaproteobacteria bacterium]
MKSESIKIGLVGLGTVGGGVYEILEKHRSLLAQRIGAPVEIKKIAVRSKGKKRGKKIPAALFTEDVGEILRDPEIRIVVEVMGGTKEAKTLAFAAIKAGKHLVTANKALLALHGKEVFTAAMKAKVDVCFEAAVGGGIPILRALREGFVANEIRSLYGIVNGTCNFILTEMSQKGADFQSTLKRAQELGYAEADPTFDIDGWDAAHKLAILVSIAYGVHVPLQKLFVEGIRRVSAFDLECAKRFGFEIKLLAIAKSQGGKIQARVHPTMIPAGSMLAAVRGVHNAISIDGDSVGEGMLYGAGAGSGPTASAVVGDIVEVARNLIAGVAYTVPPLGLYTDKVRDAAIESVGALRSSYYLRFQATDRPGVLSKIAAILGRHRISISSVYQNVREEGRVVPIVILTHEALEKDIQAAIAKVDRLEVMKEKTLLIRVEENCR